MPRITQNTRNVRNQELRIVLRLGHNFPFLRQLGAKAAWGGGGPGGGTRALYGRPEVPPLRS
jgi:hypothetical protein